MAFRAQGIAIATAMLHFSEHLAQTKTLLQCTMNKALSQLVYCATFA